jgi:hypothetical protein
VQALEETRESFLLAPGWLMGGWNKDGWNGYWHVDRPHSVMAHMVGIGGKHQHGKKLGFKARCGCCRLVPSPSNRSSWSAARAELGVRSLQSTLA